MAISFRTFINESKIKSIDKKEIRKFMKKFDSFFYEHSGDDNYLTYLSYSHSDSEDKRYREIAYQIGKEMKEKFGIDCSADSHTIEIDLDKPQKINNRLKAEKYMKKNYPEFVNLDYNSAFDNDVVLFYVGDFDNFDSVSSVFDKATEIKEYMEKKFDAICEIKDERTLERIRLEINF
jgi:ribonuclease BN (tRNA processing enzyme)